MRTLFGPAKHKYLADIITLESPSAARAACLALFRLFASAKTLAKKLRIARATRLAANRAYASSLRRGLNCKREQELRRITSQYAFTADAMFRDYNRIQGKKRT